MKRIIKISGEMGVGKSHLLCLVAERHKNHLLAHGNSTLSGILQAVRELENVTLLIDECPAELLAELEAITEHSAVWGRIGCVYAVVRDPVVTLPDDGIEDCQKAWPKTCKDTFDCGYNFATDRIVSAIKAVGVRVEE